MNYVKTGGEEFLTANPRIHIVGIGNLTRLDDGVAIRIIQKLQEQPFPQNVKITDLGTGGIDIALAIEGWDYAIIIDAIDNPSLQPGEIKTLTITKDYLPEFKGLSSSHGFDAITSLQLAFNMPDFQLPNKIYLIGIQVKTINGFGLTLSSEVEQTIPKAIAKIRQLIKNLN
jgi:hydrogenase maturation protease